MLIREAIEQPLELLSEGTGSNKDWWLRGIVGQAEVINKNGRLYPSHILEREFGKYQDKIQRRESMGELEHPPGAKINLDRVSHLFTQIHRQGNNWHAKAKVLSGTPCGAAVKGIIAGGGRLGFSTRGLGSISETRGYKLVNDDFQMITSDIVGEPSAPDAWTTAILENLDEYIAMEDCELICESIISTRRGALRRPLIREGTRMVVDKVALFERFWTAANPLISFDTASP